MKYFFLIAAILLGITPLLAEASDVTINYYKMQVDHLQVESKDMDQLKTWLADIGAKPFYSVTFPINSRALTGNFGKESPVPVAPECHLASEQAWQGIRMPLFVDRLGDRYIISGSLIDQQLISVKPKFSSAPCPDFFLTQMTIDSSYLRPGQSQYNKQYTDDSVYLITITLQ